MIDDWVQQSAPALGSVLNSIGAFLGTMAFVWEAVKVIRAGPKIEVYAEFSNTFSIDGPVLLLMIVNTGDKPTRIRDISCRFYPNWAKKRWRQLWRAQDPPRSVYFNHMLQAWLLPGADLHTFISLSEVERAMGTSPFGRSIELCVSTTWKKRVVEVRTAIPAQAPKPICCGFDSTGSAAA